MVASLLDAPPEILQKIVLFTDLETSFGLPRDLLCLLQTCRTLHRFLIPPNWPKLYALIFARNFDVNIPANCLGNVFQDHAHIELRRRFSALQCFRRGHVDDPFLPQAFWIAYFMMLEDEGINSAQLHCVGSLTLVRSFLQRRLYEGSVQNSGWPLENETNSLGIALLWLLSSQASIQLETKDLRNDIMHLLRPYVFAAFRYPLFQSSEYNYDLTRIDDSCRSIWTMHGPYPPPRLHPREVLYFGHVVRTAQIPSASLFATLSYFTRLEMLVPTIPPHLTEISDETEGDGGLRPTLEDAVHFAQMCKTHFHKCTTCHSSSDCGIRLITSRGHDGVTLHQPTIYRPGSLTGVWQGSYIPSNVQENREWLRNLAPPVTFEVYGRQPLYITLQEHFCYSSASRVPYDSAENGMINAWLPPRCQWFERGDGIEIFDKEGTFRTFYESYRPGDNPIKEYTAIDDVIITGKTEGRYAAAWGAYKVLGRVRLSDGLIVLSRESLEGFGATLLRAYVTSSHSLVGRMRALSTGAEPAEWEAPFSLSKDRCISLDIP